ncbi:MAG: CPBP family intramembrane metalloprotease [Hamadaea sp.]|nr:CPBP family intramembrane metalloprotease [Hamadaea sp.]
MEDVRAQRWTAFWTRGGIARALLASVGYLALYLAAGKLAGALFGDEVDTDDFFGTAQSVLVALTLPLIFGAILLSAFVASLGWFRAMFARQPLDGRGWMWLAPIAVAVAVGLRLLGAPYGDYAASVVVLTLVTGLLVGFVEELLTRGVVVKMLRDAGKSEWVVMVVSSLIFAFMHATNLLSGMSVAVVAATVGFTFGFGVCMYLTLRVTRNLLWPMLLHGLNDAALFLATGGIDKTEDAAAQNTLLALAAPANVVFLLIALLGVILVRGRANRMPEDGARTGPARAS